MFGRMDIRLIDYRPMRAKIIHSILLYSVLTMDFIVSRLSIYQRFYSLLLMSQRAASHEIESI